MTVSTTMFDTWATQPLGKVVRTAVATSGMVMATLVLMNAAVIDSGSWALVVLGVALAATSIRAARVPSASRLAILTAVVLAIPISLQIF